MYRILFILTLLIIAGGHVFAQTPTPTPKTIIGGVVNGKAVNLVKPEYPDSARAANVAGQVTVQVTIDEQGNIIEAKATSGPQELRAVSEKAALQSKFSPTTLQGQPARVSGAIVYNFQATERAQSIQEKLKFMGIGGLLVIARIIPMDSWEVLQVKELENEIELKELLLPLTTITPQTSREDQVKVLDQVMNSLDQNLKGDNAWQFRFGKEFGALMIQFQRAQQDPEKKLDEQAVKAQLSKMDALIGQAPADFPPAVLVKFREMTKLAAVDNLNSPENKARLIELITDTLNTIAP